MANQGRTTVVSSTQVGAFVYQSTAEFSPVSQQLDSGLYTCEVMVTPSAPSSFMTSTTSLSSLSVAVHGKRIVFRILYREIVDQITTNLNLACL